MEYVAQGSSLAPAEGESNYMPPRPTRAIEGMPESSPTEMVQGPGKSLAPAEGPHEPSPIMGPSRDDGRSQTGAASDYGTEFDVSHGQVIVPAGTLEALPMDWASASMRNSQPDYAYRPTLTVALRRPGLIYRPGSARRAGPGPESQGPQYPPARGTPMGQPGPLVVPPGSPPPGGFKGEKVTAKFAARFMGKRPRGLRKPRQKFNPLGGHHGR